MYVIFTDTDTDITTEKAKEFGFNLISMPYTINGKDVYPYVDFEKFDCHEFYNSLRNGAKPTTFGLSPEKYKEYFEPFFKEGKDILYIHLSSAMTGTFQAMNLALDELKAKYPERKFYSIDTKAITVGAYNIVCEVGDMFKAGKTAEEIVEWSKTEVDKFATYFFVEDLSFFKRSGRVKSISAFFGNLLGIRPILTMNSEGTMEPVAKVRGQKATINKVLEYVETLQDDIKNHRVIIGHSDAKETANLVAEKLKSKFGEDLKIEFVEVNPTAGSHCGPDGVGVCFHANHR